MNYYSNLFVIVLLVGYMFGVSSKNLTIHLVDPFEIGECEKNIPENEKETEKNLENLYEISGKVISIPGYNLLLFECKNVWEIPEQCHTIEIISTIFNPPEFFV